MLIYVIRISNQKAIAEVGGKSKGTRGNTLLDVSRMH